jgi:hypothetical protein
MGLELLVFSKRYEAAADATPVWSEPAATAGKPAGNGS